MILPADPSLKDLQLFWEKQYWDKHRTSWCWAATAYENFVLFFGPDRKPRDIFRSDVAEYKIWCKKKGWGSSRIRVSCDYGSRLFHLLDEIEVVEHQFNPFLGMAPRRINDKKFPGTKPSDGQHDGPNLQHEPGSTTQKLANLH